tara:strand:- start:484 stop:936 length:453 start_codon:yes stop_codon:yes gene_type:complete
MKKILTFCILILLNNCSGYSPIFSSKQINFYIDEIIVDNENKLLRKIVKNLKPYTTINNKKKISLELALNVEEKVTLRDTKGNVATEEMKISLNVKTVYENNDIEEFSLNEKFSFSNQSNKFELNQYKKSIQSTLVDKIFQDLIIRLRAL